MFVMCAEIRLQKALKLKKMTDPISLTALNVLSIVWRRFVKIAVVK